jgi:hypothetical protein
MSKKQDFNLKRATLPNGDVRLILNDSDDVLLSELRDDEDFPEMTDEEWEKAKAELLTTGIYRFGPVEREEDEDGVYESQANVRVPADLELDYMGVTDTLIEEGRAKGDPLADQVAEMLYGGSKLAKPR